MQPLNDFQRQHPLGIDSFANRGLLNCLTYYRAYTDAHSPVSVIMTAPVLALDFCFNCIGFGLFTWPRYGYLVAAWDVSTVLNDEYQEFSWANTRERDLLVGYKADGKPAHLARLIEKNDMENESVIIHKPGVKPLELATYERVKKNYKGLSWRFFREIHPDRQPSIEEMIDLYIKGKPAIEKAKQLPDAASQAEPVVICSSLLSD